MRFSHFDKPMFRVAFEAGRDDTLPLLDFARFLYTDDAAVKIQGHPLGPSDLWAGWASETYIGFSTSRLMLQSGHRFTPAEATKPAGRWPWQTDGFDIDKLKRAFHAAYPGYRKPAVHDALYAAHPGAYMRAAESVMLSGMPEASRMLEIGAGNCVHVAYRHPLNPGMRTTIIDLPESMFAGYCLLRLMNIDVALPHEDRAASVVMRLPYQEIEGTFDFAFNCSSFQEMKVETVNRYIALVRSVLTGTLQHVNMTEARHIPGNRAAEYDMSGFADVRVQEAPFHSFAFPHVSVTAHHAAR